MVLHGAIGAAIRSLPGIGPVVGALGVRSWVLQLRGWGVNRLAGGQLAEAQALKDLLNETGFKNWSRLVIS